MNARVAAAVLGAYAFVLLRAGTSDLLLRFVRPTSRPWVIAAGLAFAATALYLVRIRGETHKAGSRATWLVLAPVLAVLVIGPPPLGAFTAERQPVALVPSSGEAFAPIRASSVTLTVLEFALRSLDHDGRTLRGHEITTIGFVLRVEPHGFVLARLTITCCAADARAVEVWVVSGVPVSPNEWVRVDGHFEAHGDLPRLNAVAVTPVGAPADPYES